jgi:hypothetical protein
MLTSKFPPGLTVDTEGTTLTTAFAASVVAVVVLGIAVGSGKIGVVFVVEVTEELLHPLKNILAIPIQNKTALNDTHFLFIFFNFKPSPTRLFHYFLMPNQALLF